MYIIYQWPTIYREYKIAQRQWIGLESDHLEGYAIDEAKFSTETKNFFYRVYLALRSKISLT